MRHAALLSVAGCFLAPVLALAGVTTITYPDFSSTSGLNLVGSAATVTGYGGHTVLRLTPAAGREARRGAPLPSPSTPLRARSARIFSFRSPVRAVSGRPTASCS